jgi:hypothetical protein
MSSIGSENLVQPSRSLDSFKLPAAQRLRSDQEALQTAHQMAKELEAEASARDQDRRLPHAEIELLLEIFRDWELLLEWRAPEATRRALNEDKTNSNRMSREIRLNALDMNCVGHQSPGLWAHPRDLSYKYKDLEYWTELARILERGKFDGLFIADVLGPGWHHNFCQWQPNAS